MNNEFNRKIILEDGSIYKGIGFGANTEKVLEIVFNTSMTGYQEILSDPSYTYQAVALTYPLIGNYGIAKDDFETYNPSLGGFIVGEYNDYPSNFRSINTLSEVMKKYNISGIYGLDTRRLNRTIRDKGTMKVIITDINTPDSLALERLRNTDIPKDAVSSVSTKGISRYISAEAPWHIVAIDCGIKQNIIRSFVKRNCSVTVVPYNTSVEEIVGLNPDGIFISNGPGDPSDVPEVIGTIKELKGRYPIFGICLGHQIISLAYGGECYKLKFGHRGGNHPVKNLLTGKVEITSQNHSYAVKPESLKNTPLEVTHINLLDNTVEGLRCVKDKVFSVQYHPESAPGPEDSPYLFDQFIELIKEGM